MFVNKMPPSSDEDEDETLNAIAVLSQFIDDHLSLVRIISACLGIAGLLITAKSIKLMTRFGSAAEIPSCFIEKNISITGRVRHVTEKGILVEHVPIHLPVLSSLLTKRRPVTLLDVRLAGVEMTSEGQAWIGQQLRPADRVWLRLIGRESETLHCLVSVHRGFLRESCVNEELLRRGLARTSPLVGVDHHSRIYWSLWKRFLRSEVRAEKRRTGLWQVETTPALSIIHRLWKWTSRTREK